MIRIFQSKDRVEAVEFSDSDKDTILALIKFTEMPVTVDYAADGSVRAGLIRNGTNVIIVKMGQFVYKSSDGSVGACDYDYLAENYEEVESTS